MGKRTLIHTRGREERRHMKIGTILSIAAGFSLLCYQGFAESALQKSTNVVVESQTLLEVGRTLSRERAYGIVICVEEATNAAPRFSFAATNVSLQAVMNNVKSTATNYDWCYDEKTDVVNIYPVEGSMLDWTIEEIDIEARSVADVFVQGDLLKLSEHGITFDSGRGNMRWLQTPITLKAKGLTARQALNMMCTQLPFKTRWELQRVLYGKKMLGVLSFRWCY